MPSKRRLTVVVYGDSITADKEITEHLGHLFGLALHNGDDIRFVNASQGGRPAAAALKLVEAQVLVHQPDVVFVQYGFNDVRHDTQTGAMNRPISTPEEFETHLSGIVEQIRAAAATTQIVLIGNHRSDSFLVLPTGKTYEQSRLIYKAAAERVAQKFQTHWLDMEACFDSTGRRHTEFIRDMVHLSPIGQLHYASFMANKLQEVLYTRTTAQSPPLA